MIRRGCKGDYAASVTLNMPHVEVMGTKEKEYSHFGAYYEGICLLLTNPRICGIITISLLGGGL